MRKTGIAAVVLLLSASSLAQSQQQGSPQPQPTESVRPDPPGLRLNSLSTQASGYLLSYPAVSNADTSLWYVSGGVLADIGWLFPGRQTQMYLEEQIGYNRNGDYSTLNGFDNATSFRLRRFPDRRKSFELGANFESRLVATALFQPSYTQQAAQNAANIDDLSAALTAPALPATTFTPVDLVLSGARITMGSASTGFSYSQTTRLSWVGSAGVSHVMRADSANELLRAQYPAATSGTASLGGNYIVNPRTRIAFNGNYMHVQSSQYQFDWDFGAVDVQRSIGRRSFGHLEAGYGRVVDRGQGGQGRNAYTIATGAGTIKGNHTVLATFRRGGADYRGLGLDTSLSGELSWAWASSAQAWSLSGSGAFERLSASRTGFSGVLGEVDAIVIRATLTRRITTHSRVVFEGAYVDTSSPAPLLLSGGGFRIALVWTPTVERRRH